VGVEEGSEETETRKEGRRGTMEDKGEFQNRALSKKQRLLNVVVSAEAFEGRTSRERSGRGDLSPSSFLLFLFSPQPHDLSSPLETPNEMRTNVIKHCPGGTDATHQTPFSAERSTRGGWREPRTPVRSP